MTRTARFSILLALSLTPPVVRAQSAATAPPSRIVNGFDVSRLARIDQALQTYVDKNEIAGAVALVLRDGQPVYQRAVGWADKESSKPMTMDAIFRIASQSKAITSTAVLMLFEEGKINLDDPVSRFIPQFAHTTVATRSDTGRVISPAKREITIHDLLTHTSGISYGTDSIVAPLYAAKGLGPSAGWGWYIADKNEPVCTTMERLASLPKCTQCEYRVADGSAKDGFAECWGALATPRPHMLELFSIGTCRAEDRSDLIDSMFRQGKAGLFDIPEACLVKADGSIGPNAERQRRQIEYTRRGEVFISPDLPRRIEKLAQPLTFIDFETSRLALPYHRGMRAYGLVAFQWSCHTVASHGQKPVHTEWLNNKEAWPNRSFAESLRGTIGDEGPVLTWSHFEATTLKQIIVDLDRFGHVVPELFEWMTDVFDRRIVDMHEWARRDYYHPGMRGRTSIKVVLDALWKSDATMRSQFEAWTGMPADASRDPYASLPPVEISGVMQDVHEGTGAMRAYQEMMYGVSKHDPAVVEMWSGLLKRYCELDTLSMVLILEHWRRCVGLA